MPVFSYRCTDCDDKKEVTHALDQLPLLACEICGGVMEKILTRVNPLFIQDEQNIVDNSSEDHQCHSGCVLHQNTHTLNNLD